MRMTSIAAALFAALLMAGKAEKAEAGLFISITVAPPALPVYEQPPIPAPNYLWSPGYWSWDDDGGDYYWVPGAWVAAPEPGVLWTPGYWGWRDGVYAWNAGYWGPTVGFYGGVDYGFGFTAYGFFGGSWRGGAFVYNGSCTHIGVGFSQANIVYNKTVIVNNRTVNITNTTTNNITKVSYNGGTGGTNIQPSQQQLAAANERHLPPTTNQMQHQQLAAKNPDLKFSKNHGRPTIAATSKAGDFSKGHVFAAKTAGGPVKPASFKPNTVGNVNKNTNASLNGQSNKPNGNNQHLEKKNNFVPPKGAGLNQTKRPGPPPGPKPVNKQPPKKDEHHN